MRVLIFGANGYIGRHTAAALVAAGHSVTGFVRSDAAADQVRELGAQATVGVLDDAALIQDAVARHDAFIWLVQLALDEEQRVVDAVLKALRGTNKCFVFTGGASVLSVPTAGEWSDQVFAETDSFVPRRALLVRAQTELLVRAAAQTGVRSIVARPPLIYGDGGCKVISDLYHSARQSGAVCYVGRGLNAYSHAHVDDVSQLLRLAVERGSAGALYHGSAGEANFQAMAQAVADTLGVGTRSVDLAEAQQIWDRFTASTVFSSCSRTTAPVARTELGWAPAPGRPGILEECRHPAYAAETARSLASWVKPGSVDGRR